MIPFLAPLLLRLSPVGTALKHVPRWVWIGVAVVAILLLGTCAHKRAVKKFGEERYAAGVAHEQARMAEKVRKQVEADSRRAEKLRSENNETNRIIDRDADALRVRGAGKAACLNPATASPGRRVEAARPADAAVDQVPDRAGAELIAMPFADALSFAESHDKCIAEAMTWREDKRLQIEAFKAER